MLNQMRQHSQSWVLKFILAIIIVSFILFWGSQDPGQGSRDSRSYATVNGYTVSAQRVENQLKNSDQIQDWEAQFGGKVPDFLVNMERKKIVEQIITQTLVNTWLTQSGLKISKMELMESVKKIPGFQDENGFNYKQYVKTNERYAQSLGVSLEETIKNDLLTDKLIDPLRAAFPANKDETAKLQNLRNELYSFAVIKIRKDAPPEKPKMDDKKENEGVNDDEDKKEGYGEDLAKQVLANWQKKADMKKILEDNKLKITESGEMDILNLKQLLNGTNEPSHFKKIAGLSKAKPFVDEPLLAGSHYYLIKFLDKKSAKDTENEFPAIQAENEIIGPAFSLLNEIFIDELRKDANIKIDLPAPQTSN